MVNRSIIPLRLLIIPMILLYDDYPILQQSCQLNLPKSNPINSTIRLFHSRYVPTNPHFTRGSAISQVSKTGRTPCSLYFKPFTALFLLSIQLSQRGSRGYEVRRGTNTLSTMLNRLLLYLYVRTTCLY